MDAHSFVKSWESSLARTSPAELRDQITTLKAALRDAILNTSRTVRRTVEVDPAGNTCEVDWSPRVKTWATLCDLNIQSMQPPE